MSSVAVTPAEGATHGVDEDRKVKLGMLFYVLADVAFVVFLFVSYIWERAYNTNGAWFPYKGMALPDQHATLVLTGLMVGSGIAYFIAHLGIKAGNQAILSLFLLVAVVLVAITLVGQMRFMGDQQFATGDGTFASSWLMLAGYHVYHLFIGMFLGLALLIRSFKGRYSRERHLGLVTVGYFWYWMALMPVLVTILVAIFPAKI